jgi:hypothetical protein
MRITIKKLFFLVFLGWSLLSMGCSLTAGTPTLDIAKTATNQAIETELSMKQAQTLEAIQSTSSYHMTLTALPSATPRPTKTPIPTQTATSTPLPTDTATPVPPLTAILNNNGNLRSGPGVGYTIIVSLTTGTEVEVLEKDPESGWFRVMVVDTGQFGWISIGLLTYDFDIDLIPIAEVIPPTPTYAPVQPTTSIPDNFDVHIAITNGLDVPITIYLSGTYTTTITVQSGQTLNVDLPTGSYSYTVYAYGYNSLSGSKSWDAGEWTWDFYAA